MAKILMHRQPDMDEKKLTPFQRFKRSKPSDSLESIRFKYFKLPPELRELVESEASKEGSEGLEWIANVGLKLQEKGLNKDQISKLFASQAPTIADGSQKSLIDFLNSFLGPQDSTGDSSSHFRPQHSGNKNYVFSGTELQPLKSNAIVGDLKSSDMSDTEMAALIEHQNKTGNLLDSRMALGQPSQADLEKLKNPPMFSTQELDEIRSTFEPYPEHQRSLQSTVIDQMPPTRTRPPVPISFSSRIQTNLGAIQHTLFNSLEFLVSYLLLAHLQLQFERTHLFALCSISILFLCTNYIYGFFQHQITWLWPLIGMTCRLSLRIAPFLVILTYHPAWKPNLLIILSIVIKFGLVRAALCVLGKENSTTATICALFNAAYIAYNSQFEPAKIESKSILKYIVAVFLFLQVSGFDNL